MHVSDLYVAESFLHVAWGTLLRSSVAEKTQEVQATCLSLHGMFGFALKHSSQRCKAHHVKVHPAERTQLFKFGF